MSTNGKFRTALNAAGFGGSGCLLFNDKRKGSQRVKLWNANAVFNAPPEQQWRLKQELRDAFGEENIIKMQFALRHDLPHAGSNAVVSKSLCIYLKL